MQFIAIKLRIMTLFKMRLDQFHQFIHQCPVLRNKAAVEEGGRLGMVI